MDQNAFAGQAKKPSEKALAAALGKSQSLWNLLLSELRQALRLEGDWHSSSVKLGWSFRLQLNKRNIVYLGPRPGYFVAAFVLGDKAIAAARNSDLPTGVLKLIAEARRYAEGTAVRIQVKNAEDLDVVKRLAKIKVEH